MKSNKKNNENSRLILYKSTPLNMMMKST